MKCLFGINISGDKRWIFTVFDEASRCIFGVLPSSTFIGKSIGLLLKCVSARVKCFSFVASPITANGALSLSHNAVKCRVFQGKRQAHNAFAIRYTKFQVATFLFHRTRCYANQTYRHVRRREPIQASHLINRQPPRRE